MEIVPPLFEMMYNMGMKRKHMSIKDIYIRSVLLVLLAFALTASPLLRAGAAAGEAKYTTRWELTETSSGNALLTLWVAPAEGVYTYSNNPGGMSKPTVFKPAAEAPTGAVYYVPGVDKPDPVEPSQMIEVYKDEFPIFVEFEAPAGQLPATLQGKLEMILCTDVHCWPAFDDVSFALGDVLSAPLPKAEEQAWWMLFEAAKGEAAAPQPGAVPAPSEIVQTPAAPVTEQRPFDFTPQFFHADLEVSSLAKAILFGLLAGLLLNFMPCVLPVISLKLSAVLATGNIKDGEQKAAAFREHNIFFALGILTFFAVLGALLGLAGMAWGQLFQKPTIIMGVTALIFALGLSLFGLYDLPLIDLKGASQTSSPKSQAYFTGLLATLLATPCSGPFLGGVLGWALSQQPEIIIFVFFAVGLGMALPYLVMCVKPDLVRIFPKPGNWTTFLERLVGFFLMGTCVYLMSLLPIYYVAPALILLLAISFSAWMWGQWVSLSDGRARRWSIRIAALFFAGAALVWTIQPPTQHAQWTPYTEELFFEKLGKENILMDFTAEWCPNCKLLEKVTLTDSNLKEWRDAYGLTLVQLDMTEENARDLELLRSLGSNAIPIVVIFPKGERSGKPVVLRDLFTAAQLESALEETLGGAK